MSSDEQPDSMVDGEFEEVEYIEEVEYVEENEVIEQEEEEHLEQTDMAQNKASAEGSSEQEDLSHEDIMEQKSEQEQEDNAGITSTQQTTSATEEAADYAQEQYVSEPSSTEDDVPAGLKQLEENAALVAKEVQEVAKDVSRKLTAGFMSAFGSATEATSGLTNLTSGLSSWWNSLDVAPPPKNDAMSQKVHSAEKASSEIQAMFGLSPEEQLVESFRCKLLQTYGCTHNTFTPSIQMAFQGTLYITDRQTCFSVEERGQKMPFKVPHAEVVRATRQRPARKGDLSDVLKLELSSGRWLAFKDFENGSALDSALALVEHLMES